MQIDDNYRYNDYILDLEVSFNKTKSKDALVQSIFVLWYVLVECIDCESFSESALKKLLQEKVKEFEVNFSNDSDVLFVLGWGANVAFWFFGKTFKEDTGIKLLLKANKLNPGNPLFKWAVSHELKLKENEIQNLSIDLRIHLKKYYDFGDLITEYFTSIIK